MCGGYDERGQDLKSVEQFDSRVGEWQNIAPMCLLPRYSASAASLNGEIYVTGGMTAYATPLETVKM